MIWQNEVYYDDEVDDADTGLAEDLVTSSQYRPISSSHVHHRAGAHTDDDSDILLP